MHTRTNSTIKKRLYRTAVVLAAGANGLGVVRGLHAKGISCVVACRSRTDLALMSRLPAQKVSIPPDVPLGTWLPEFVDSVESVADCIIPTSDEFASTLRMVNKTSAMPLPCILPPDDLVDVLNDKKSEIRLIRKLDIPHPRSVLDLHDLKSSEFDIQYPLIAKPRTYKGQSILNAKNQIIENERQLQVFLGTFAGKLDAFLIQEVVPGDESGQWVCNATFDHSGEMISAFTFQRLGTNPYLYGVTTVAVSRHNPDVKSLCASIGKALRYRGPAMFEFKFDPRTQQYCYIETNPRLGMCNWFDTRCGVQNVFNTYALSVGIRPVVNVDEQLDGACYLDITHDVYARLKAKQRVIPVLQSYASSWMSRTICPAWYWRDPLPALSTLAGILDRGWKRVTRN